MEDRRQTLLSQLEAHYRGHGWSVRKDDDGTLMASGPGGVTWLGRAVVEEDLGSGLFEQRIVELADRRMPQGAELCPLDLVAAGDCADGLRTVLDRLGLSERPHVSLYSVAA